MKRSLYLASLVTIVSMGMSVPAFAQCPAGTLTGRWTFAAGNIVGQFVATQAAAGFGGRLSIASTTITGGTSVTRSDNDTGSFAFDPDCRGGLLYLNLSGLPIQWIFVIVPGGPFGTTLTLRATGIPAFIPFPDLNGVPPNLPFPPLPQVTPTPASVGTAWPAPTSCPVANPLNVLTGSPAFSLTGRVVAGTLLIGPQNLQVPSWLDPQGTFTATVFQTAPAAPNPYGLGPVARGFDPGTYTVTADCTRATFYIYFDVPRPFFYDGYARRNTAGVISFSVIAFGPIGNVSSADFVPSAGTIN